MRRLLLVSSIALIVAFLIAACDSIAPASTPTPAPTETPASVSVQGLVPSISNLPVQCKSGGINCMEGWNGATYSLYAGAGISRTIFANGATGDMTTTGTMAVGTWVRTQVQTSIVVTGSAVFTPTGTFQPVSSLLNVTPTLSTALAPGIQLLLENQGAFTITLPITPANVVVVPGALKAFYFDGTQWVKR